MHPLARKDSVVLLHGSHAVQLRPTLRAAIQLERLHDGWTGLLAKLAQLDTATIREVIRTAASDRIAAEGLLRSLADQPLTEIRTAVLTPLSELLELFLMPLTDGDKDRKDHVTETAAKPLEWVQAYAELFKTGTALLGWSPADTWASTPAEIAAALEAKVALLGGNRETADDTATTYTTEQLAEVDRLGYDPSFDREGLRRLKGMV